jgi:hypothetical protein
MINGSDHSSFSQSFPSPKLIVWVPKCQSEGSLWLMSLIWGFMHAVPAMELQECWCNLLLLAPTPVAFSVSKTSTHIPCIQVPNLIKETWVLSLSCPQTCCVCWEHGPFSLHDDIAWVHFTYEIWKCSGPFEWIVAQCVQLIN